MFVGRYRWLVVLFLFIAGILNYVDRAALSTVAPLLMRDLELSPGLLGILFSSFAVGYAACCFIGGWAADRFGPWPAWCTDQECGCTNPSPVRGQATWT